MATAVTAPATGSNNDHATFRGGFSSSICGLFQSYRNRSDCCALACCGLLLSDRTRFVTSGERVSWCKRLLINLGIPLLYLVVMSILTGLVPTDEETQEDWQSHTLLGFIVIVVVLSLRARSERMRLRRLVMEKMYNERTAHDGGGHATVDSYLSMHSTDIRRAHASMCCYPNDALYGVERDDDNGDFCTCIWKCLKQVCCGACCNTWLQCCGMCATGQEWRQIDSNQIKMDYVTFQPFQEYNERLVELRRSGNMRFGPHARALSLLSKKLLQMLGLALLVLLLVSLTQQINGGTFTPLNLLVLLATLFQAFFILWLVHWNWCRLDLSLDAVVKYFGSGFVLCTGLAIAYEMLISSLLGVVVQVIVVVGVVQEEESQHDDDVVHPLTPEDTQKYAKQFAQDHPFLFASFIFLNAFVVAALVEELSKYFSYWMVEHPDFEDLDSIISRSFSGRTTYLGVDTDEEGHDLQQRPSSDNDEGQNVGEQSDESASSSTPRRSLDSLGRGVTVAMVATALGFACCENLLYVFVYTPPTVSNEISTLVARSLFPVHPLAAAIQSIGVCQRDLEGRRDVGVGKIILAAWFLHGSFDFVLMLLAFLGGLNSTSDDQTEQEEEKLELPAVIGSVAIMLMGIVYYICMARAQRRRLLALDLAVPQRRQDESVPSTAMTPLLK